MHTSSEWNDSKKTQNYEHSLSLAFFRHHLRLKKNRFLNRILLHFLPNQLYLYRAFHSTGFAAFNASE